MWCECLLLGALQILEDEIQPNADPALTAPEYRKSVAVALLYKVVIISCIVFKNKKQLHEIWS